MSCFLSFLRTVLRAVCPVRFAFSIFIAALLTLCIVVFSSIFPGMFFTPAMAQGGENSSTGGESSSYHEAYYVIDSLNIGLPEPGESINLQTPQAALEHLVLSARAEEFANAAHALNLNLLPVEQQATRAGELAHRLSYVLHEQYIIDWDSLPDRADGQENVSAPSQNPVAGEPRRSILLGTLALDGRDVALRVQRVKAGDSEPVWVISPNTVENIDAIYAEYGPSALDRMMPQWARGTLWSQTKIWEWFALLLLLLVASVVGWLVWWLSRNLLRRSNNGWMIELSNNASVPLAVAVALTVFYIPLQAYITLTGPFLSLVEPSFYILFTGALLWLILRIIEFSSRYFGQKYTNFIDGDDIAHKRRVLTLISVARRVLLFAVLVVGIGIALSEFRIFRTLGISLLASAGVMSVIVAVAARPVLGNIVAGIQLAATRPIRIGDTVMFEGNWAEVEEITHVYVTLLTWDERRVIVPLRYLMDHPIENWSRTDAHTIRPIYLYLDYRTNVEAIRQKFDELVRESEQWDGEKEPTVQVTETSEETITLRLLASGATPGDAWELHCMLLEQMLRYVQELEAGRYLPHERMLLQQADEHRQYMAEHQPEWHASLDGTVSSD